MRVELGAGARPAAGFVALDLNPVNRPAIVADALHLPFADESLDEIRAVDVLEHISYRDTDRALAEWARCLRPGGGLFVQVPDAETIMLWFAFQPEKLVVPRDRPQTALAGAEWRLLGGHADGVYVPRDGDFRFNAHFSFWSDVTLREAFARSGLFVVSVEVNAHPNLIAKAVRAPC